MPELPDELDEYTWEQYLSDASNRKILEHITHVGHFTFTAQTNFLGGWDEDKDRRVTLLIQRNLQDALEESGFHNLASLEAVRFRDGLEFRYQDPDYQFNFGVDGRGRIMLSRPSSTAEAFHDWYRRFMPSFTQVLLTTVRIIDEELTGLKPDDNAPTSNQSKARQEVIRVERASYAFKVAVQIDVDNTRPGPEQPLLPNIQVLNQTLLSRVPSAAGSLSDPSGMGPQEFGRIDYSVSRWNEARKVAEHYSVSAPSNNRWRLLLFTFGYVGETYIPSAGNRKKFDDKEFLTGKTAFEAYLDFFRQRCVCGFLRDVLYGDRLSQGLKVVRPQEPGFDFVTPTTW
jgi:hypothetical protein